MTVRFTQWRGVCPRAIVLAVAVALTPVPALAQEMTPAVKASPQARVTLHTAVAHEAAKLATASAVARHDGQSTASSGNSGFFKTKPGMIALVVMAVGTGYALYSTQHDRVKSPAKQ